MGFFHSGAFWFIEGVFAVLAVLGFIQWAKDHHITLFWWKWAAVIITVLLICTTVAFVFTSIGEGEPVAALRGGILFSLASIILMAVSYRLLQLKNNA